MGFNWQTCPMNVKEFVLYLNEKIGDILQGNLVGFYVHGSLAMGGFNPYHSDIDILVVTEVSISVDVKRQLTEVCLVGSNNPFPVEVSVLTKHQLDNWQHPSPFEFHYSEFWRERYEQELANGTNNYINEHVHTDPDLAAHLTITFHRGICIEGKPIHDVFPNVPREDYVSSIIGDYEDCLENVEQDPVYCILNMLRVFMYVKDGIISSKEEAGRWGMTILPEGLIPTVEKAAANYANDTEMYSFNREELIIIRDYIKDCVTQYRKGGVK
ncbi:MULTISPECIES: aminoglycoside adenylyltransferase domain-containing protein [Sutcliffiella]|uniref:Spectinomycin 9-adenylyltransferase n=1 Tax=Sutcliffiella cohnii TaxID=33932 RepID=A0A223KR00_9BACI|nr:MULTISPECIES: aminoglycoside adenylyltransferase domain-containing protein [Sutcliffiella]AST91899.1 hypothetical protein BC6307_11730 [Sutcliffiella cohnii]WBL13129.1 DUF4111 domain-containing protein [Sutcliffiella sp. NC1]